MKLPVKELKRALADVSPVIHKTPINPILSDVRLITENGIVTVIGSNLQTTIRSRFTVTELFEKADICLPADKLKEITSKLNHPEVELRIEGCTCELTVGSMRAKITGESSEYYPILPEVEGENRFIISSDRLKAAVSKLEASVSNDDLRPVMTSYSVELNEGQAVFRATNGHTLAVYTTEAECSTGGTVNLHKSLSLVKNLFRENQPLVVRFDGKRATIEGDNITLEVRLLEERFPDIGSYIAGLDELESLQADPKLLIAELQRAEIFSDRTQKKIRLEIGADKIRVYAEDTDYGNDYQGEVEVEYNGPQLVVGVNVRMMSECISRFDSEQFTILHKGKSNLPLYYKGDGLLMLQMPMML